MSFLPKKKKLKNNNDESDISDFFIWKTNSKACDTCLSLQGYYWSAEDIPERPHPNCLCWIEYISNDPMIKGTTPKENKAKAEGDASSTQEEIQKTQEQMNNDLEQAQTKKEESVIDSYINDTKEVSAKIADIEETIKNCEKDLPKKIIEDLQKQEEYYRQLEQAYEKEKNKLEHEKENPFIDDVQKHQQMKDLIDYTHQKTDKLPDGYEEFAKYHDEKTGLDVTVFKNGKDLAVVFPGSDLKTKDVLIDSIHLPVLKENPQAEKAQEIFDKLKENPEFKDSNITVAGYSLGGNTAQIIGAKNNVNTVTFEPFQGAGEIIQKTADKNGKPVEIHPERIINYQQKYDPITKDNDHLGTTYETQGVLKVDVTVPEKIKEGWENKAASHDLSNIGRPIERIPESEKYNGRTIYLPKT